MEEVSTPLLIFPEEVWRMIFDQVEGAEDLLSAQAAHPEFRRILNETRTIWMFTKVFPHLVKHLGTTDVLVSRQVCQPWNQTIFQFFEQHPTLRLSRFSGVPTADKILRHRDEKYPAQRLFKGYPLTPQSVQDLYADPGKRKFLREHPILGRHVHLQPLAFEVLEVPNDADEPGPEVVMVPMPMNMRFMREVLDDLKESTWYLTLEATPHPGLRQRHFYDYLATCLQRLPNLKSVRLTGSLQSIYEEGAEVVTPKNLPALPSLEAFVVEKSLSLTSHKILNILYHTYGAQLKNGKSSSGAFWEVHHSKDLAVLGNLEQLELWSKYQVRDGFDAFLYEGGLDYELYDTWKRLSCPVLQILKMDVQELKMRSVFKILQSCPALVALKMNCVNAVPGVLPEFEERFQPPRNLKVLEVNDAAFVAEDFLEKIPSLEVIILFDCEDAEVTVTNSEPLRFKIKGTLWFTPDGKEIYASNIWRILRRLKKFFAVAGDGRLGDPVSTFQFTRETYESVQNKALLKTKALFDP